MNMEEKIVFNSGNLKLEGYLNVNSLEKGVVVTHPHPLYGGDMTNMVVELITRTFISKGFSTLRFNFRGVGCSQGSYSHGTGEAEDVCAAANVFKSRKIDCTILAGYSFGVWVNTLVNCRNMVFKKMLMVSPPVALMDFNPVRSIDNLTLVITGSLDEFAPPQQIINFLATWNPSAVLEVIDGADHFFWNHFKSLDQVLGSYI